MSLRHDYGRLFTVCKHPVKARCGATSALILLLAACVGGKLLHSAALDRAAISSTGGAPTAALQPHTTASEPPTRTTATKPDAETRARVSQAYGRLPMRFEANAGQHNSQVRFTSRGAGYNLFLTPTEAVMVLSRNRLNASDRQSAESVAFGERRSPRAIERRESSVVRMRLVGAHRAPQVTGEQEQAGRTNYFIGNDSRQWQTNVTNYGRVRYAGVYPGIDLIYYGNQGQLEYDFVVAPGADPSLIALEFRGAQRLRIDAAGELVVRAAGGGEVRQHRPVIYQEVNGERVEVTGGYVLRRRGGREKVGFQIGGYDVRLPLVIDPVLVYSTYLGGTDEERAYDIAVDSAGNAYVTGITASPNFPLANPLQPEHGRVGTCSGQPCTDVFVTKIDPSGSSLVYSTYLGGSSFDDGYAIAVDRDGNSYVTGFTFSANFPTFNPLQSTRRGFSDVFITKIDPSGSSLIYSTYLGGNDSESGDGIAVDTSGNAYVSGHTNSADFPTTAQAFQPTLRGSADAFVTKINAFGTLLLYSTYLGGTGYDSALAIAVDRGSSAYITGVTYSTDFPTVNPLQSTNRGISDVFVTKLDASGSSLVYSTYLGGSDFELGRGIAMDSTGSVHVTGETRSANFPTVNPLQSMISYDYDAFVTKLDESGSALVYSTYLGGNDRDFSLGIEVDAAGNTYVAGFTNSTDFPLANPLQSTISGLCTPTMFCSDAFVTKINNQGSILIYSTYLGGNSNDSANGIAVDSSGNAYIVGYTVSSNFPVANPFQATRRGSLDAFVSKIGDLPPPDPIRVVLSRDASGQLVATITITNPLPDPVFGVQMTLARASTLDGSAFVDGVPVPQLFGTVNPEQSVTATVTFPGTEGVPSGLNGLVRVDLSYTGGTYSETKQVVTP